MVRITLLVAALASSVFAAADKAADNATEVAYKVDGHSGCITFAHLQALGQTYNHLEKTGDHKFPAIPEKYINDPTACIPPSLYEKYYEPIVAVAKEQKLLENYKEKVKGRGLEIFRRARNCPEIKAAAIGKKNTYSCISAPNPSKCESCANFATANFLAAVAACIAGGDGVFCCAAAATAFGTYYTQTCLEK
ncbi:hypothetical protein F53441_1062 [Fusarium austroafricanum]|uniref:Uncharacterized protein n=1 Tax=Fusarium austroafricanum TaxID=2364996 RepID=A0A8H4KVC9_9HYPO|nr:hypothetical protein F53441_1062 [Fusarium austroafricanum]